MKIMDVVSRLYLVALMVLIYLPVVFLVLLSFKSGAGVTFPIESFTFDWYVKPPTGYEYASYVSVLFDRAFWKAATNSVYVSVGTALLTASLVTTAGLALRHRVIGRDLLFYLLLLGFIIPGVTLGLGNALLHSALDIEFSLWSAVAVNTVYAAPFGLVLMMARFDPDLMLYERAASVLGASPLAVFRRVTLPLIRWEVLSSGIFGFILAWSEVIRTQFVMKGTGVLATFILTQLQINPVTPKWYAVGATIGSVSLVGLVVLGFLLAKTTPQTSR